MNEQPQEQAGGPADRAGGVRLVQPSNGHWRLQLSGDWTVHSRPHAGPVLIDLGRATGVQRLGCDASALGRWDSFLPITPERIRRGRAPAAVSRG